MATHLEKSDPAKLAFRFSTLGATLQAAQDFSVVVDVQFGANEHARYRAGEGGTLFAPDGSWVPGAKFAVLAERNGATTRRQLIAVPAGDADYHLGLPIGGFTIGADGHPDPASAWDLATARFSVPVTEVGALESRQFEVSSLASPAVRVPADAKRPHTILSVLALETSHRLPSGELATCLGVDLTVVPGTPLREGDGIEIRPMNGVAARLQLADLFLGAPEPVSVSGGQIVVDHQRSQLGEVVGAAEPAQPDQHDLVAVQPHTSLFPTSR